MLFTYFPLNVVSFYVWIGTHYTDLVSKNIEMQKHAFEIPFLIITGNIVWFLYRQNVKFIIFYKS